MNTTHTNEPTEPSAKQVAIRLGGEISLRDYFAAKAMQGLMDAAMPMPEIAAAAYAMADDMLKAREA
jgi:hypothetical protein